MVPHIRNLVRGLALASLLNAPVWSHEGVTPHATLVQRESDTYSLSLNFDLIRALHLTTQPALSAAEFMATHAAMTPERFAPVWSAAVALWSREIKLAQGPTTFTAARWQWPTAAQGHALVRERLMQQLTQPAPDTHGMAQARADFQTTGGGSERGPLSLKLHAAMRPLSVTSYRAHQQWVGQGDAPIALRF